MPANTKLLLVSIKKYVQKDAQWPRLSQRPSPGTVTFSMLAYSAKQLCYAINEITTLIIKEHGDFALITFKKENEVHSS